MDNIGMEQDNIQDFRCAILSETVGTMHRMILGYLRDLDYQVDIFHDEASLLKSIDEYRYSLLLVDIDMPGLDVLSFLSHKQHVCPETSMVMVTGNEKMDTAIQALKRGAADILVKPINLFYLDAALEKSVWLTNLVLDRNRALEDMEEAQAALKGLEQRNSQLLKENESLRKEIQQLKHKERSQE